MKKTVYIIPGLGERPQLARYRKLMQALVAKGYRAVGISPDWKAPISGQLFKVGKTDVVVGFSLGAVLAYLVSKKYPCGKVILASMTPVRKIPFKVIEKIFVKEVGKERASEIARDLKSVIISLRNLRTPYVTLKGEREKGSADFLIPKTGHYISKAYSEGIVRLL